MYTNEIKQIWFSRNVEFNLHGQNINMVLTKFLYKAIYFSPVIRKKDLLRVLRI